METFTKIFFRKYWELLRIPVLVTALGIILLINAEQWDQTEWNTILIFAIGLLAFEYYSSKLINNKAHLKVKNSLNPINPSDIKNSIKGTWSIVRIPASIGLLLLLLIGFQDNFHKEELIIIAEFGIALLGFEGYKVKNSSSQKNTSLKEGEDAIDNSSEVKDNGAYSLDSPSNEFNPKFDDEEKLLRQLILLMTKRELKQKNNGVANEVKSS